MSLTSEPRSAFWTEHFHKLADADAGNEQLDFSSQALVVQNYAYVLEACGVIAEKRILDVGFGNGDLSRTLDRLGGSVTAFDAVSTRIARLRQDAPSIAWWHDDIASWKPSRASEPFDLVIACETLQYVEFNSAVKRFLSVVADGGRLVILIPNADCPVVRRVSERFDHKYVGVSMTSLEDRLGGIAAENYVAYRGIYFQDDQSLVPYQSGPWNKITHGNRISEPHFDRQQGNSFADLPARGVANRLQIVIARKSVSQSANNAQLSGEQKGS